MNVSMPIAAVLLDLGFPRGDREGDPAARAHRRPARPPGRGAGEPGRLPDGGQGRGGDRLRAPTRTGRADARRPRSRRARGPSSSRSTTRATAPSSPTSSSARRSTARSSPRRASPRPRRRAGSRRSRGCRSPRRTSSGRRRTPDNPFGAHLCATRDEIVRIYSTSGTTGTPSYIPLTAGDLDNWVTGSARSYARLGRRRRPAASSRPTTPGRSSPARRSPRSTASASATSRSAPATPSG